MDLAEIIQFRFEASRLNHAFLIQAPTECISIDSPDLGDGTLECQVTFVFCHSFIN
jgi:hypothetical protein